MKFSNNMPHEAPSIMLKYKHSVQSTFLDSEDDLLRETKAIKKLADHVAKIQQYVAI